VAFEQVVHEVERLAGAAWVVASFLEDRSEELPATQAAQLLTAGPERQAALLRLFMAGPGRPEGGPGRRRAGRPGGQGVDP
jgi:hypothetical protein